MDKNQQQTGGERASREQLLAQIEEEAPRYGVDPDHLIGRLVYGVGTRLITSQGAAALDGVYKLVAVRDGGEWACPEAPPEQAEGRSRWMPAIKLSETPAKTLNPGDKRVWRVYDQRGKATADLLSLDDETPQEMERIVLRHPTDHAKYRALDRDEIAEVEPLLVDVLHEGKLVCVVNERKVYQKHRTKSVPLLWPPLPFLPFPHGLARKGCPVLRESPVVVAECLRIETRAVGNPLPALWETRCRCPSGLGLSGHSVIPGA